MEQMLQKTKVLPVFTLLSLALWKWGGQLAVAPSDPSSFPHFLFLVSGGSHCSLKQLFMFLTATLRNTQKKNVEKCVLHVCVVPLVCLVPAEVSEPPELRL